MDKNRENGFGLFTEDGRKTIIARANRFDSKYDYESYYDGEYGNFYYEGKIFFSMREFNILETYGQATYDPTVQMPFKKKVEDSKIVYQLSF